MQPHDAEPTPLPKPAVEVKRAPGRASYDRQTIDEILDAAMVAHVGTVRDGLPVVIPMYYVRDGDVLLLHGAPATGTARRGRDETVCVTVTLVDGLVLARSAFHHSMNYRSVVVIGVPELIADEAERGRALDRFVEAMLPGRTAALRATTAKELRGTAVLRLPLTNASAKVRSGPPIDDDEDYALDIWAGVVPMRTTYGDVVADPRLTDGIPVPEQVTDLIAATGPVGPEHA